MPALVPSSSLMIGTTTAYKPLKITFDLFAGQSKTDLFLGGQFKRGATYMYECIYGNGLLSLENGLIHG